MAAKPKLVTLGWHRPGTGLTRVVHEILRPLSEDFAIHHVGLGYEGPVAQFEGWTLYPALVNEGDVMGAFQARKLIETEQPDACLMVHDIWMMEFYARVLEPEKRECVTAVYFPLDGLVPGLDLIEPLSRFDAVALYTPGARDHIAVWLDKLPPDLDRPRLEVIPHGVDPRAFRPLADDGDTAARARIKREVFADLPDPESSFIALNACRPDPRKNMPATLEGFARFARDKPDNVRLCLHHSATTAEIDTELHGLAERLGIANRVYWNPLNRGDAILDDGRLNLLYNACDVGLNTSSGEGWGLVSFEHAAAGRAQIVPRHSACAELWEGAARFLEPVRREVPEHSLLEMAHVSADGVAEALEELYADAEARDGFAKAGRQRAAKPEWQWPVIGGQWKALFRELC